MRRLRPMLRDYLEDQITQIRIERTNGEDQRATEQLLLVIRRLTDLPILIEDPQECSRSVQVRLEHSERLVLPATEGRPATTVYVGEGAACWDLLGRRHV